MNFEFPSKMKIDIIENEDRRREGLETKFPMCFRKSSEKRKVGDIGGNRIKQLQQPFSKYKFNDPQPTKPLTSLAYRLGRN